MNLLRQHWSGREIVCAWGAFFILGSVLASPAWSAEMPWIKVSEDKTHFVRQGSTQRFVPWGVNYDHDDKGRLLEDYWVAEWPLVESHFAGIKELKANLVRIHLQFGRFMNGPGEPNQDALRQLGRLIDLAERTGLYLDVTGLGCYHKKDVPAWYDDLSEKDRWNAQSEYWRAVAKQCRQSPAVFCYDLMNEPVVPGGRRKERDWLGPDFAGKHFVQVITLDQQNRPRPEIARAWLKQLTDAIRSVDDRHLITVGLVDWSLDRPGLTSGFVPKLVSEDLDFLCVHIYPEAGKLDAALETLGGFAIGKPVIIEETFPLKCTSDELVEFIQKSKPVSTGWVSFYWGDSREKLQQSSELRDALVLEWLKRFESLAPSITR